MKKLILITLGILLWTVGYSQTENYEVIAWDLLEAQGDFVIDEDTFRNTTQMGVLDTTIVSLDFLSDSGQYVIQPFETIKMDITYIPTGDEVIGEYYWDDNNETYSFALGNGVVGQLFFEDLVLIKNTSGSTIYDGTPVMYAGSVGGSGKLEGTIAIADGSRPAAFIIGIATETIPVGEFGKIARRGQVRGIDASGTPYGEVWNIDDFVYVSADTTSGKYLTNVPPEAPDLRIAMGVVVNNHAVNGTIEVSPSFTSKMSNLQDVNGTALTTTGQFYGWNQESSYFDANYNINSYTKGNNEITKEPTGFFEPENVISTYNTTNRTVTLTGTVLALYEGDTVTHIVSGWTSPAHDATDGGWFLYATGKETGDLVWSQTPWEFNRLQISYAYYSATDQFALREVHGLMPYQAHKEFHELLGTYFDPSTSNLSDYTLSSTTDRQPDVSYTTVNDEDLQTTIPALTTKLYTRAYLETTGLVPSFDKAQTDIVSTSGNRPYWNEYTTAWGQTLMTNNSYMIIWLVETPQGADAESQAYGRLWVQGQINTTSLDEIEARTFSDIQIGSLGLTPEFVATHKITLQYTAANWRIYAVEKLTGSKISQTASTPPSGLVIVTTDETLTGTGQVTDPLKVDTTIITTHDQLTDSLATKGDVFKFGTPVDNQVSVWRNDSTIEGFSAFTYATNILSVPTLLTSQGIQTNSVSSEDDSQAFTISSSSGTVTFSAPHIWHNIVASPSASNGMVWYNTTTDEFEGRRGGTTIQFASTGDIGGGTVTSVSSLTTNQLTVANGTTTPDLTIVTGAVADLGTALATGDQIHTFVTDSLATKLDLGGGNNNQDMDIGDYNFAADSANFSGDVEIVSGVDGAESDVLRLRSNYTTVGTGTGLKFVNSTGATSDIGSEIISIREASNDARLVFRIADNAVLNDVLILNADLSATLLGSLTAASLNATNLTTGYLPYDNGTSLVNSVIKQSGTFIGINISPTRLFHIASTTTATDLHLTNTTTGGTSTDGFTFTMIGTTAILNNRENGVLRFQTNATERMRLSATGELTVNENATFLGSVEATKYFVSALNTAPSSATDTGTTGEIRITATYIYVCSATNTWVRTQLTTW